MSTTMIENQKMQTPKVVSKDEWLAARDQLLAEEKRLTRERDALAAKRRRMPWLAVEKSYQFEGPNGKASLLDLFEGRRQLIVYRAFFEPGVFGWPDHACRGCSLGADQISHLSHLNARDTTLVFASRAPQADIQRLKARMDWKMPWYTITDSFDVESRRRPMARPQHIHPRRRPHLPHLLHQQPRRRSHGQPLELSRYDCPSDARRTGKTRPPAILKLNPTSGGTGTICTPPNRSQPEAGRHHHRPRRRLQKARSRGKSELEDELFTRIQNRNK